MADLLVSVITVCLNSEKYIEDTILSVLKQNYKNLEYIIVDGGSTDKTVDIIKKYLNKFDGRLNYLSEADDGIYDAMNKGIELSNGEIIGIINSDDWYEDDTLNTVVKYFVDNHEVDVVHGNMNVCDENKNILKLLKNRSKHCIGLRNPYNHSAMFVRKRVFNKYGGYDKKLKISADYDFNLMLKYNKSINVMYIDETLSNFRNVGLTSRLNFPPIKDYYILLKKNGFNILWIFFVIIFKIMIYYLKKLNTCINK